MPRPRALGPLALAVALAACSPAKREPSPPHAVAETDASAPGASVADAGLAEVGATDAGPVAVASSACPATYGQGVPNCVPTGKVCEYPEGTCTCAGDSYCGGVAPTPEILKRLAKPHWKCQPSPKILGADGCPLSMPNGGPCKSPGKECHYSNCCSFTVTCVKGTWLSSAGICPP
jgi:hypothetical protein